MIRLYKQKELIDWLGLPGMIDKNGILRLTPGFEARLGMTSWDIPQWINNSIKPLPNRVYCNKRIVDKLEKTFEDLIQVELHHEIRTWDGCFNVRMQRGSRTMWSRHSWGLAIDMNAAWNPLGGKVTFSQGFLNVWRKNGWICGADWKRPDGMHFEIGKGI